MINSESKRLSRMIQTFLDVERLSDGQMELKREPFEARQIFESCLDRVTPIAERKNIRLEREGEIEGARSEEHTSELQSPDHLVCRLLLEKKKQARNKTKTAGMIETLPRVT